jgi:hypothetical protein
MKGRSIGAAYRIIPANRVREAIISQEAAYDKTIKRNYLNRLNKRSPMFLQNSKRSSNSIRYLSAHTKNNFHISGARIGVISGEDDLKPGWIKRIFLRGHLMATAALLPAPGRFQELGQQVPPHLEFFQLIRLLFYLALGQSVVVSFVKIVSRKHQLLLSQKDIPFLATLCGVQAVAQRAVRLSPLNKGQCISDCHAVSFQCWRAPAEPGATIHDSSWNAVSG